MFCWQLDFNLVDLIFELITSEVTDWKVVSKFWAQSHVVELAGNFLVAWFVASIRSPTSHVSDGCFCQRMHYNIIIAACCMSAHIGFSAKWKELLAVGISDTWICYSWKYIMVRKHVYIKLTWIIIPWVTRFLKTSSPFPGPTRYWLAVDSSLRCGQPHRRPCPQCIPMASTSKTRVNLHSPLCSPSLRWIWMQKSPNL